MELLSPRLCLRSLRTSDAAAIVAYRSLEEVARYQSWETYGTDDAARLIENMQYVTPDTPGTWLQLALTLRDSGTVIGDCGLHFLETDSRQVELGITLGPLHQHKGFAAEAVEAVLKYLFKTLNKHRVCATTDAENHAAAGLFKRLGFRQEGHFIENVYFKGSWGSEFMFATLQREWREGYQNETK